MTASRARRLEVLALLAILALAAVTRLPGLADRGRWDADQGHDMLVLRALAVDGEIPLLGPRTSIGTFHHGAVYYYLLAPAAIASAADPVAVTVEIALFGIAAVAGAWWLARLVGGPRAAVIAGLLAAVSPAGIDESTFIWNPNLIPAAAALAFAGAILARRTGRARWWIASAIGAMVTMQCHVLGVVVMLPLAWAWVADLVRRRRAGHDATGVVRGGIGAVLVVAAGFLPLLAYELGNDFAETRGILDYVAGGGRGGSDGLLQVAALVGLRSITWPIVGLITDRVTVSLVTALLVALLGTVALLGRRRGDRLGVTSEGGSIAGDTGSTPGDTRSVPRSSVDVASARWLAAGLGVSVLALAAFAPSLAVIVPGLPNDHYHAFLDPIVLALVGVGLARVAATSLPGRIAAGRIAAGRIAAGSLTAVLVVIAVTAWPPAVSPDGGWPLAEEAATRVEAITGDRPFALDGIPPFKSADAMRFPFERHGAPVLPEDARTLVAPDLVVLVCDPLFDEVVGAPCGGPAEDAWLGEGGRDDLRLLDRFEAGPRRVLSVYGAAES